MNNVYYLSCNILLWSLHTRHARHHAADVVCDAEQMSDCRGVQELVLKLLLLLTNRYLYRETYGSCVLRERELTGTFFCVTTMAQSFPRTATDVSPPWLMALNAYSVKYVWTTQYYNHGQLLKYLVLYILLQSHYLSRKTFHTNPWVIVFAELTTVYVFNFLNV